MHAHARLVGDSGSSRGSYRLACARVGVNAWVEWWVWPCVGSEGVFLGAVCVPLMVRFAWGGVSLSGVAYWVCCHVSLEVVVALPCGLSVPQ